jgi:hypothetical protein
VGGPIFQHPQRAAVVLGRRVDAFVQEGLDAGGTVQALDEGELGTAQVVVDIWHDDVVVLSFMDEIALQESSQSLVFRSPPAWTYPPRRLPGQRYVGAIPGGYAGCARLRP